MEHFNLVATCAGGLETLVSDEIRHCGGVDIEASTGVVSWCGGLEEGYRSCLWSRFSSRIFLEIASFSIKNEEDLYARSLDVRWYKHLEVTTTFAVNCTISGTSPITHNRYAALKVKDALVDSFRNLTGERPNVKGEKPDVQIHVHIDAARATLFLDLSGESLHRRGYRASGTIAPLKETLGAAIVALSGWPEHKETLIDPMCGSGTLLIEAALMFGDSAPGLSRNYFGFLGWRGHDEQLWQDLIEEAMQREDLGLEKKWPLLLGYDSDPVAVSAARKNIIKAGLEEQIQVKQADLATLAPPTKDGMVLSNLPYGERLSEAGTVAYLYRAFGRVLKRKFPGWRVGAFISNPDLTDSFTLAWDKKDKLFNGSISCRLLSGEVPLDGGAEFVWQLPAYDQKAELGEFGNRLKKNLKNMLKWAGKEKISCFRIYDRDLPDFNLSIDIYAKWVHVQEYAAPKTIDQGVAKARLSEALGTIREVLGIRSNRIFIKKRERQKGAKQYEKKNTKRKMYEVQEGECSFLVNFTDYLDTGLFLDHRPVRQKIFEESRGKRFLNLYGYTGTASVHAAMGGAASTSTVDLSLNYLNWTRTNFVLNGLSEKNNIVIKEDCLQWLKEGDSSFDLIFIDPPTFSNTKKEKRVFDVQRDHKLLLTLAMNRLEKNGLVIFSTNYRRFKLDESLIEMYAIVNISEKTIPYDFSRNKKIHSCWEVRHRA